MIKHIIIFNFKEEANGKSKQENMEEAKQKMLRLLDDIKEIRSMDIHFNDARTPMDNHDFIMESTFDNVEDLAIYQQHPSHIAFGNYVKQVRASRVCIDYEFE